MTELHDLLAREADRIEAPSAPSFESLVGRARRRRTALRASCAAAAAIAVAVAIVVPNIVLGGPDRVAPAGGPGPTAGATTSVSTGPSPSASTSAPLATSAEPVITSGPCAGLAVAANVGAEAFDIAATPAKNTVSLRVGDTLLLAATGPCHESVRVTPTTESVIGSQGQLAHAADGVTVYTFTADQPGAENLELSRQPTPCPSGIFCALQVWLFATVTVVVDQPADANHVGVSCKAGDLAWRLAWKGDDAGLTGSLTATNTSGKDCDLLVKPTLTPLDESGTPLGVEFVVTDELRIGPAVLRAGASASSPILWAGGWCGPPPGPLMRVTLPGGSSVDVAVSGPNAPACGPDVDTNLSSDWFAPLSTPRTPSTTGAPSTGATSTPGTGAPSAPRSGS